MAYRRSLSIRATLHAQRFHHPSLSYICHDDEDGKHQPSHTNSSRPAITNFLQHGYCNGHNNSGTAGFGALFREKGLVFSPLVGLGSSFCSYSSSTIGEESDEIMNDVAEVISENGMEVAVSQAPVVSEVTIAAADSFAPVAFLQHLIDGVHCFTGLNWWVSIALTTIMIRTITIPLLVNQLKCTTKLTLMRPRLEEIKLDMKNRGMEPEAVADGQKRMKELFREYGVTPFTPLKGLFIQGPIFISFYLAITNMVEKVPSLKEGGAFWFTDLTTPDSLYIFPVLTALTFLITVECNMQEGLEGNPVAGTIKNLSRVFAVLTVPLTMSFPQAIFCYWVTSNLFSLVYGLVIKRPQVKNFLGVPIIPIARTTAPKPALSLFSSTPATSATQDSSSTISQRLRYLEEQVKGRNKDEKM